MSGRTLPSGRRRAGAPRRSRAGLRSNLLFVLPIPLAWRAFFAEPFGLLLNLAAVALLLGAAWLTREGLLAEDAYEAREVARRPALPRKLLGGVLTGAGLAVAAVYSFGGLLAPLLLGLAGAGLHALAFGPDPMRDKPLDGDVARGRRLADALAEAEAHLAAMEAAVGRTGDAALLDRVARFRTTARAFFHELVRSPADTAGARRFLTVYLRGGRDACAKYAALDPGRRDAAERAECLALLDDLDRAFAAETERLVAGERADLAVEIDVLRERLAREGLGPKNEA